MPPRFAGIPVAPKVAPIPNPPMGMIRPGNIDPHKRPIVNNADGSISTVRTISTELDGQEVLLPTVSPDGRIMDDDQAIDRAIATGEDFGAFRTPEAATQFAERLHNSQADEYLPAATTKKPRFAGVPVNAAPAADPYLADLPVPGAGPGYVAPGSVPTPAPDGGFNETAFAQGTSGVNEGIATVLGAPVDLTNSVLRLGAAGVNAATGSDIQLPENAFGGRKTFVDAMAPAIRPESADPTNQMIRRVGEEVGAAVVPAGAVVARSARPLASLANQAAITLGSGGAAAVAEQVAPDNPYVELAASILGGGLAAGGISAAKKAITPFEITPQRAAMNDIMRQEGVDLTPGQMTGSKGLQYAESELGGQQIANLSERQSEQFTQAALSRAGIAAERATPEVIDNAFTTIGQQFDDLALRNTLIPDQQLGQDIGATVREYNNLVPEAARAPIINNLLGDVVAALRANGNIPGEAYQSLTSRLGRMARGARQDPQLSDALQGIRGALDGAMERSIQANNPSDLGGWQQARTDYRNLLVLETAASRAGENTAMGLISPANLRSAVAAQGKRGYVRGQGDFADLARGGVATMTPLPQSGTAPRQFVRNAGTALPAVLGAGIGGQSGDMAGALMGAAAGAMVPGTLGKLMLSAPGRSYLTNQAWTGPLNLGEAAIAPGTSALLQLAKDTQPKGSLRALALN